MASLGAASTRAACEYPVGTLRDYLGEQVGGGEMIHFGLALAARPPLRIQAVVKGSCGTWSILGLL